jgi:hypothetical protein
MTDDRSTQASAVAPDAAFAAVMAAIACSSILVPARNSTTPQMPSGYDATDIRILDWIVSHRRRPQAPARLARL